MITGQSQTIGFHRTQDIVVALEIMDPAHAQARNNKPALYALADVEVETNDLDGLTDGAMPGEGAHSDGYRLSSCGRWDMTRG